MNAQELKKVRRHRRTLSTRSQLRARSSLPRLSVHRSTKHISAQVIDDRTGRTLAAATTTAKSMSAELGGKTKSQRAALIGAEIAKRAKAAGVEAVVFDRGPARYHGRVKALAEAAREAGLKF
jgi:large subunit ribosomal protein L18